MAKKCCSCSRFFSCLSCFSRGNDPDALPPVEATSSDALPPAEGTASSDVLPPVEGASSSDALPPVEGASSSDALPHVEGAASSDVPAVMEIPSVGTSSSATEGAASSDVPAVMEIPSVGTSSSATEEGNVDDVDLDALLEDVSNLLEQIKEGTKSSHKKTKTAQQYLPTTSKSFNKLKEFLSEAANFVKDIVPGDAIKTVASGILQGMGMAHLATAGLVVVVSILERFDEVSANKTECLRLLREMIFLAKLVKQFKERSQLKETMHDVIREATELIVESSIKCLAQMKSSKFSKFFSTSANKGDLESFTKQLDDQYKHIYAQMGISFFDIHACMKAPISRGYPEHAVGVEEPVKEVTDLLDWASEENALAVMLHGFGGMGKTTLANAVFSLLDLKGYKYSKVQLFKYIGSTPDIVDLQKQILKDLMEPQAIPDIRTPEDGQRELGKALEKQTAFIYIDNVLGENELRQLLPKDIKKAKKLRLLLTARDENVRRGCPVKTLTYHMRSIPSAEAMSLLRKELSNGMAGNLSATQLNRMMEICGGIPLMLTLATGVIRCEEDKQKAYRIVMHDRQKMKGQTFQDTDHYLFAFDSLPDTCKDPFLDICSFFSGWDWNTVADIVGETELDVLERRALVTKGKDGVACIHDVISTIGLQKTEKLRFKFTSASEVEELLNSNENEDKFIKAIKGIWLSENKDPLHLNASKLDLMHSSLRILALGDLIKVAGKCKKGFENLAYFQAGIPHLPFDILKAKKLAFLSYEPATLDLPEMPSNLKHIEFHGRRHSDASEISSRCLRQLHNLRILRLISFVKMTKLPTELGDRIKGLEELSLSSCESVEELPGSTSNLQSLKVLKTDHCSNLKRLPDGFSKLQTLEVLRMDYCSSLEQLTEDFGALKSLQELNLEGCTDLQVLPKNFENLSLLKLLNLSSCTSLEELPPGLGNMKSLVTLDLYKCEKLKSIPESIGQLQSLSSSMNMSYCSSLTELPDAFCNLSFITHFSLQGCKSLHRLPDHFGKLANLRMLKLSKCRMEKLPESFGLLVFLEELDLSGCGKLGELCNNFPCLSSLRIMYLANCPCLKKLPKDFDSLVALQQLYLCNCNLENLPDNFYCLPSLEILHLHHCPTLEGKCMDHVIKIKKLQSVYIEGSPLLLKRWAEIQREGDQSWPFTVHTGQDLSEEEATNMQKKLSSDLDGLLTPGKGELFHLSNCPPNTSILVMLDNRSIFNSDYPWALIEETLNDIQIKFGIVYIGKHFDKLPMQVENKILGYALYNTQVEALLSNLYRASQLKIAPDSQSDSDDEDEDGDIIYRQWSAMIVGDGKDDRYLSCWKCLSKRQMEEFVVAKCGKFLRLKQLAETNQESNIEILREMFATREEESTDHIFQKNCASHKARSEDSKTFTCGIDELKGKTIILDIRDVEVCYDVRLESLAEMYITAKERLGFEIISIPILPPGTKGDVLDIVERFSSEVPWLVLQNPWTIATTVKYFLLKQCSWIGGEQLGQEDEELEAYYPSIIWILESNRRVTNYKHFVIPMLDRWGAKCYPFEDGKIKELRKEEWEKQKNMSSLEFLFTHLGKVLEQVKEILLQRKMICLYGGDQRMNESTCSTITELRNMIHIIYIPTHYCRDKEKLRLTHATSVQYCRLKKPDMSQVRKEGVPLLSLSEHEAMRFWTRISSLKKEIYEMDNWTTQLDGLEKLLDSFERSYSWMTLMDKDGEMVTDRRKEIVHNLIVGDISEDKEKELLLQEFLHMFKQEDRNEEGRFSEEPMDKEEQHKFQAKIELCNSVADSMPGELQGESGIPSAKASPTAGQEEYMTSASSSAPNA